MALKIAIIGAGPGGLCLANILQHNDIPFTVFEGDNSAHERNQGGTLDLHPSSGQLAMKEAGVWDQFCQHSRPEADVTKIVRIDDGEVLWDGNGPDKHEIPEELRRPEIDREKLKDILLENLDSRNLKFGMHLKEVVSDGAGKYDLHFRDGVVETGYDLVVGADGTWSKVRKLLTDDLPHYSGISSLELWCDNVDETNPWLSQYVGAGSCFSFGAGRAIQMQRLGNDTIRIYASLRKPENFFENCGIDFTNPEAVNEYVDRYFSDIGSDLKRAMLGNNSKVVPRVLWMLPVGFQWVHRAGITLLGDAAHVMTPFAGVGVNAALADALDLGRNIIRARDAIEPAQFDGFVQRYETSMFERGEKFAKKTWEGLQSHFSADGAERFAKKHRDAFAEAR